MFRTKAQAGRTFLFAADALHHQIVGYLEVAKTLRYKGPTVIPFAIVDERKSPVSEFAITPSNMNELFLAAKEAKYKPLTLLSNAPRGQMSESRNFVSFPQMKDGFPLSRGILTPSRRTPTFGLFSKAPICLSEKPTELGLHFRVRNPLHVPGSAYADPRLAPETSGVVLIDPSFSTGQFCITPDSVQRVFDLCASYSLEPIELRAFMDATGQFELQRANEFIAAHAEGQINRGEPIYVPGFDINESYKNRKVETTEEVNVAGSVDVPSDTLDTPTAIRQGASVTSIGMAAALPPMRGRSDIQARQAL
jgi:hypothetical protein